MVDLEMSCEHFVVTEKVKESLRRIADHAAKVQGKCTVCRTPRAVWCCLDCYHIGCGRYEKKHAWSHANKTNHFVCVNMESPKHLWCYKCDKGIVYFGDEHSSNDNSSASQNDDDTNSSPSSSQSSNHRRSNGHRKRMNNDMRSDLTVPPHQWKGAQQILKSTPIWGDSMNGGKCGMQNLGNTCFMNASLQALLHCPSVIYLFTLPEILYVKRPNRLRLVDEFVRLTYQIWEGKHRNVIPKDILRCIMYKFPQFRGYGQQDAHEFLTCLLQFLHDQYKYSIPIHEEDEEEEEEESTGGNDDEEEEEKTRGGGTEQKVKRKKHRNYEETSIIYDLFSGEIISQVECCRCHTKSKKIESITNIQVEIPKQEQVERAVKERNAKPLPSKGWFQSASVFLGFSTQSIPLSLCLHSYCTSEDLLEQEKYHCDTCKSKQEAKKNLMIRRLPEILMIQIKRFSHDTFWRGSSKVGTHVDFPVDALDLKEYIDPKHVNDVHNRDTLYDCCSIVRHMGSTGGGHYVAYAKHPATGKWFKYDDSRVEPVSPEKLAEQQAYILFYSRRRSDRNAIQTISKTLTVAEQLKQNENAVLLSRYWLHRVQAFSRPGPIDNLWMSCGHGAPLRADHERRRNCAIKIGYNSWLELTKKYGVRHNASMMQWENGDSSATTDIVMVDSPKKKGTANGSTTSNKGGNHSESNGHGPTPNVSKKRTRKEREEENEDAMSVDDTSDESMMKAVSEEILQHPPWESNDRSEVCPDCESEQLSRRREYEKAEIRRLEDDGCPQDCALEMKWANQWRNFVHNKTDTVPSRVDNRDIHAGNHQLKEGLTKDTHYLMIPSNIWTFLIEIYGGGPKIVPTLSAMTTPKRQQKYRGNRPNHSPPNPSRTSSGKSSKGTASRSSTRSQSARNDPSED